MESVTKVYAVITTFHCEEEGDDTHVGGVYSTQELAETACRKAFNEEVQSVLDDEAKLPKADRTPESEIRAQVDAEWTFEVSEQPIDGAGPVPQAMSYDEIVAREA